MKVKHFHFFITLAYKYANTKEDRKINKCISLIDFKYFIILF